MEAFSILNIPTYKKKMLEKHLLGTSIDYKRFNIKDRKFLEQVNEDLFFLSRKSNDKDNSECTYDGEILYTRVHSPRGIAHKLIMPVVGMKPVPIAYIEIYGKGQGLRGSVGRIDFYGAFFHFKSSVPDRYLRAYDTLCRLAEEKNKVGITRIDVAMDFRFPFPQDGRKWIVPSENSDRQVKCYYHGKGIWNSFGYLSNKNSGYGVRMYDKLIDIQQNEGAKEAWYGGKEKLPESWTRIEFEFYPPYTVKHSDNELKTLCLNRTTQSTKIDIGLEFRPVLGFKIENAYSYFERYAKNHGITIKQLIDEIVKYYEWIEMKKAGRML